MHIGKSPADFNRKTVCGEYERQMSKGAFYDIEVAFEGECKDGCTIMDQKMRLIQYTMPFRHLLDTEETALAGFDDEGRIVWFCEEGRSPKVKCDDIAIEAMERGAPVERVVGDDVLLALPVYGYEGIFEAEADVKKYFMGVVCALRPREKPPLTEWQWLRCLHVAFKWYFVLATAILHYPGTAAAHLLPEGHYETTGSWRDGLSLLTRQNLPQMAEKCGMNSLEKAKQWLDQVTAQIGFADSRHMHPDELLHSIERSLSKKETDEISRSASTTAQQLSQTASKSEWKETAEDMLNAMGAIFEQTPAVYFAMVNHGVHPESHGPDLFSIQHGSAVPKPENQEHPALEVLATWIGLTGNALYNDGNDEDTIVKLVREATTKKKPIFAIPVFGWPKDTPLDYEGAPFTSLHGVFVGFRSESAPQPSVAAWLTWIYTTQHMLAPLTTAARYGHLKYRPINIEKSIAKARQTPEKLLWPWGTFRSVRRIE